MEPATHPHAAITFVCNVCEERCTVDCEDLGRETPSCPRCQSTVRMRAIVHVVSTLLLGSSLALPRFPVRRTVRGLGMSDWVGYAQALEVVFDYRNTFFHQEPRLDIMNVDPSRFESADFLISSDVFEHVPPPATRAFENAFRLLRPGGHLVFTVPYASDGDTIEHFPDLHDYQVTRFHDRPVLLNRTRGGAWQVFDDLCFHGGDGETLEMRVFSEPALRRHLADAGFTDVRVWGEDYLPFGIRWSTALSLPFSARRPA